MENNKRCLSGKVEHCSAAAVKQEQEEHCDSLIDSVEECLAKRESWLEEDYVRQPVKEEDFTTKSCKRQRRSKHQRGQSCKVEDCSVATVKQILKERVEDYGFVIKSLEVMRRRSCVGSFLEETIQVVIESHKKCLAEWESWLEENSIRQPVKEEDFTSCKRLRRRRHQIGLSCKVEDCSAATVKQILKERVEDYDFWIGSLELMRKGSFVNPFLEETIQVVVGSRKGCLAEWERWLDGYSIRQPIKYFASSMRQRCSKQNRGLSCKVEDCSVATVKRILKERVQDYGFVIKSLEIMLRRSCVGSFLEETIQVVIESHKKCLAEWESWLEENSIRQPVKEEDFTSCKRLRRRRHQIGLSCKVEDCSAATVKQILKERVEDYDFWIGSLELMRKGSFVNPFLEETIQVVVGSRKGCLAEWERWLDGYSIRQPIKYFASSMRQRCSKQNRGLSCKVEDCSVATVKRILKERVQDYGFVIKSLEIMRRRSCVGSFLEETIQVVIESHKKCLAEWESWLEENSIRQPVKEEDFRGCKTLRRRRHQIGLSCKVEDCSVAAVKQILKERVEDYDFWIASLERMRKGSCVDPFLEETIHVVIRSRKVFLAEWKSWLQNKSIRQPIKEEDLTSSKRQRCS